jgi:hypothetical protein
MTIDVRFSDSARVAFMEKKQKWSDWEYPINDKIKLLDCLPEP